jgi:hypothetical protein
MRVFVSAIVMASCLLAGTLSAQTPLAPGKPAGVRPAGATSERREVTLLVGILLASAGVAIALMIPEDKKASATSTNSTSP